MANRELLFLVGPFLPLVAAAVAGLAVTGFVRRHYLLLTVPAAALAAICVVVIGLTLMGFQHPPTGSGGPWSLGSGSRVIAGAAVIYGGFGGLVGLLITAVAFVVDSLGAGDKSGSAVRK